MPAEDTNGNSVDNVFKDVKKNTTNFLIWRVENLHVVTVPKDQHGTFYEGDSYLVYAASEYGKPTGINTKVHEVKGKLEMHIHFWLGEETSKDDSTIAAYKSVELDSFLGGCPVQHREVQGKESSRFRGYFKNGMRILKGGIATGLHHIGHTFEPRLYRVKGRRCPLITQMPTISWEHFSSADIFILDTKDVVFIWMGRHANNIEKLQATKVATRLKEEHNALAVVFVDDGKELHLSEAEKTLLGVYLDPKLRKGIKTRNRDEVAIAHQVQQCVSTELKLYKCSDEGGTYRVTEIKTGPLKQSDLNSRDSYIVDKTGSCIWVWVGKLASQKERIEAIRNAHGFVKKKNYKSYIPVSRTIEGGEPIEFKSLFAVWKESETACAANNALNGRNGKHIPAKLDMETLHNHPRVAAEMQLMDDGNGKMSIWRVKHSELSEVPYPMYGRFYSADCYLVHYKYRCQTLEHHVFYYWMGKHSGTNDRNSIAMHAISKDEAANGRGTLVRVVEGNEPPHFMRIFHGRMIAFIGDHRDVIPASFLIHVCGNRQYNTRATQVPVKASSLNTNDVFVLRVSDKLCYVWCGRGSTGDEREMAKSIANKLTSDDFTVIYEGQEKEDFWHSLGGKGPYSNSKEASTLDDFQSARLYDCTSLSGILAVEEITNFNQTDLISEDIMLLDIKAAIYVWMGNNAIKEEKKRSVDLAMEYILADSSGRSTDLPIFTIKDGFEPPTFTGYFDGWDGELIQKRETFTHLRNEIERNNPVLQVELKYSNGACDFNECEKYPIEKLRVKNPDKLPSGVDPTLKEIHLSNADFANTFGMKYENFVILPQWKKDTMKKSVGLF